MRLVVATRNAGKARELAQLLADLPIEVVSLADYPDITEPEETGSTFAENAIIKAQHAAQHTGEIALADDSGLEVDALDGRPGIYSSRFGGPDSTDATRNALLLEMLKDVPDEKRTARFRCVAVIARPPGEVQTFDGVCEGRIAHEPRGANGFGYDPLFFLPDYDKTMAEIPAKEKNRISHRARAILAAREALEEMAKDSSH